VTAARRASASAADLAAAGLGDRDAAGEPDDIAYAALYLASREAKFVNGHVLVVNGGWLTTHDRKR
jgi:NAD(P)-dependent dehydrogenase (short-subunit alcohol dehydrogenase family)